MSASSSPVEEIDRSSSRVRIAVLGPMSIAVDGKGVEVSAKKPRAILAMLALAAGKAVSPDELIDGVWGDDSPDTAHKAVQVYVAGLRRSLGSAASRLRTAPGGYALSIAPDDVDSLRFETLVARARREGGSATWQAALDVWKGDIPLSDLSDLPFARPHVARLTEVRHAAREELIDARLASGDQDDLVAELETAVAREPYRERSWRQLILALYRAGRQAEALAAYQRARMILADDLGLDPGPALQALERAVLVQDPSLDPSQKAATLGVRLPAVATSMVDRDHERIAVTELVRTERLVTVTGPGGAGKTRLAIEIAKALANEFPGGVVFVDLASVRDPSIVLSEIARTSGVGPSDDPFAALAASIQGRRALFVLDNFEQVSEASPDIGRLLVAVDSVHVLATTRTRLRLAAEHVYPLAGLQPDAAVELFVARGRAVRPELEPSGEAAAIAELLDGLPLAIELAAASCRTLDPSVIRAQIAANQPLPAGPRDLPDRHRTLEATLAWSTDLLEPPVRRLLAILATFESRFTLAMAAALDDGADPVGPLTHLVEASLLLSEGDQYRMPVSVRTFARHASEGMWSAIADRHANWVVATVDAAVPRLRGADEDTARIELTAMLPDLRAGLDRLIETDRHETAAYAVLSTALVWYHEGLIVEMATRLDAVAGGAKLPARTREEVLTTRAVMAKLMGDPSAAVTLAAATDRLRPLGPDSIPLVNGLCHLAALDAEGGRRELAFARADEALEVARRCPDPGSLAMALDLASYVGWTFHELDRAAAASAEAVVVARRSGTSQLSNALGGLAVVLAEVGRTHEASEAAWEAISVAERVGSATHRLEVDTTVGAVIARLDPVEGANRLAAAVAGWIVIGALPLALDASTKLARLGAEAAPAEVSQLLGFIGARRDDVIELDPVIGRLREQLGEASYARERGIGTGLDVDAVGRLVEHIAQAVAAHAAAASSGASATA